MLCGQDLLRNSISVLVIDHGLEILLELVLILVVFLGLQPILALSMGLDGGEVICPAFVALHQIEDRCTAVGTALPPLQEHGTEGPTRVVKTGIGSSWAGAVGAGPEAGDGALEQMAPQG